MKKTLAILFMAAAFGISASAQEMSMGGAKPTDKDKTEAIPTSGWMKRGAAISNSKSVSLNKVLKNPSKYSGKTIVVSGVVVKSCKTEGCWAEVAENADSKSIRVKMKDHSFFIPLQSAGSTARIEGTLSVKTLSKAEVDHMIKDDGATFANRNADGTVSEVSLEATGIELTAKK